MEQRLSLVTLGVSDLGRAKRFYEALGWRGQEVEETVFFQLGGMALVLWGRDKLALDAGAADRRGAGQAGAAFGGACPDVALAVNVRTTTEVDEVLASAERAGGRITRPARTTSYGGYAGYFADPEGHLWEIAHNPGFTLEADGSLQLPDFGPP